MMKLTQLLRRMGCLWVILLLLSACEFSAKPSLLSATGTELIQESIQESIQELIQESIQKPIRETVQETKPGTEFSQPVEIHFVGDVMMDSYIGDYIADHGVDYPWTDVTSVLDKADLAVANLETSVSTRGVTKKRQGYHKIIDRMVEMSKPMGTEISAEGIFHPAGN